MAEDNFESAGCPCRRHPVGADFLAAHLRGFSISSRVWRFIPRRLRHWMTFGVGALMLGAVRGEDAPVEITLRAVREQMKFDLKEFRVPVGRRVSLSFHNDDGMEHNVVICLPRELCAPGEEEDNAMEVAHAAWDLGSEGPARHWVPKHPRVFASSSVILGGEVEKIEFVAPSKPGAYPFICSVPGHAMLMVGTMRVEAAIQGLRELAYTAYRAGSENPLKDFDSLRSEKIIQGTLPDGLIDATPVTIDGHYAMEFTGLLAVSKEGDYTFNIAGDKGTRLLVDGSIVVDNMTGHSARALKSGAVRLKPGDHRIVMRYWHQLGDAPVVSLVWSGPGFENRALSRVDLVAQKKDNDGDLLAGMKLTADHGQPVFYHNYLSDLPQGGFAVGFPGGANFSWDPRNMSLSSLWAGDFLDVKAHRTSRGAGAIKSAGFDCVRPASGRAFPESAGEMKFVGYRFDAARQPTFRYRLGALEVLDTYSVSGEGVRDSLTITRTLEFRGSPPMSELTLRVANGPDWVAQDGAIVSTNKLRITAREASFSHSDSGFTVPVNFIENQARVVIDYRWLSTSARLIDSTHNH